MKKSWWKSVLCVLLSVALLLEMVPVSAFAAEETYRKVDFTLPEAVTDMNVVTYKKDDTLREPQKYYEEETQEGLLVAVDEYSKTYQVSDDSFVTQIGGEANVYRNEKGEVQLVDNSLVEKDPWFSDNYFENKSNDYSVILPVEITEKNGVKIEKDGYEIELIPQDGDFSNPVVVDNAVLYNNVHEGIDYQYTVLGDTIKEDIVLNRAVEANSFSFELHPGKLNVKETDGVIILFETDEDAPVFTIIAPEMQDASGEVSLNVFLSLEEIEGKYIATVTADKEWLQAEERAYPVRIDPTIDVSGDSIGLFGVEQGSPDIIVGDNNYPYCGYDDGITSGNLVGFGTAHLISRTYVKIRHDFSQISKEAKIDSATFSVYHYTSWSKGQTNFGLYQVDQEWNENKMSWNYQTGFSHTFIGFQPANSTRGWVNWDVTDTVNSWIQGTSANNGFVIKAEDERNMQCEIFHNKNHANKPKLTINWSIPDPVDPNYPLNQVTVALRPITEKNVSGKLLFDAIFADGIATPGAIVKYWLNPDDVTGYASASASYKYPDSTEFEATFPEGTKYKDKLSNWQTGLFGGLTFDKIYYISATATKDGQTSAQADSDKFLIYKIKQTDTFPEIANYYGVPLNTIMRDNRVQDTLVVENNTIFIRNPQTEEAYTPDDLTDDDKKAIDSALMGRGLHCEYGFEPINLNTGNFYFGATDATLTDLNGDFAIVRTYNSKASGTNSSFGRNWSFGYDESLSICEDGSIAYSVGDGKTLYFTPDGNGGYVSPAGYYYTLKKIGYTQGEDTFYRYELHMTDGSYKEFNVWGMLTAVVDKNGFATTIQYTDDYKLRSITSPSGKVYGINCDGIGRITSILLPNGAELRYAYDENGDLVCHTDANGNEIRYVYDDQHRMTEWYDQEGNRIVLNEYDGEGRVIKQTDANGNVITLAYTANQTVTTDANGNVTKYTYDNQYRTTKIEYPNGKVENKAYDAGNNLIADDDYIYTYDVNGNKLTETRKDGAVRSYVYNEQNQVTQLTDFDGTVMKMEYSEAGDLVKVVYANGTSDSYTYDNLHRMISHTNANGNVEYYEYEGAVATGYTDFNGNVYRFSYNAMNQLITATAPDGSVTRKMYNAAGVQIGEQAADGGYTEYTLNKVGNVIRVTDPMGYASDFVYDGMYNILTGIDPQGNTLSYTYDGNGNTLTETDPEGNVITYTYDSMNRVVKLVDGNGATTVYSYDVDGNLIRTVAADGGETTTEYDPVLGLPVKSVDALGNITQYAYSANGNPTKITYPDNTTLVYVYDALGRLVKFTDDTGLTTEFEYDGIGNVTKLTENGTHVYSYTYDANSNLIKTVDPMGGVVSYTYDALNRQTMVTNENGAQTQYGYDAAGRINQVLDATGNATQVTYDQNGNVTSATAANGAQTLYHYDELGNLISEKDALGSVTNYSYNKVQQLLSATDALNGTIRYAYDAVGNATTVTDALGYQAIITYDSMGNAVKVTLENGDTTTFVYDKLGRVTQSTDAAGMIKNYTYDAMGRIMEVSDNTGSRITYSYDSYGRLISQTDVLGRSESYRYDEFSQVISVIGVDKNETTYAYDALGRLICVTDAENKTTNFQYDAVGNLIEQTESDGAVYAYTYDRLNQIVSAVDPLGAETKYTYDSEGNLTSVTDGNGVTTSYAYDKLNRLTSVVDGNGNTTSYTFDELSRLIAITEPEGGTTEYRYDAIGNITKTKDANGYVTEFIFDSVGNVTKAISQMGAEISYTYDKHNNVTSVTDPLGNVTAYTVDLNGMTTEMVQPNGGIYAYTYDEVNRITGITTPNGYTRTFEYDDFGNLISEKDNLDRVTTYEYDIMHRVTKVIDPNGSGTSYTYDASGNLSTVLEANGAQTSYTYDLLDHITSQTDPEGKVTQLQYDLVGNITAVTEQGGRTTKLTYDSNYNLVSVTDPMGYVTTQEFDGNNRAVTVTNALGNTVAYEYDALGQTTKVTDASGQVVQYTYDPHGNITSIINPLGGKTEYTYDLADRLIQVTDPMQRQTSYTYDSMGNLVSQTDGDGKVTSYTYDLEGNMTSLTDENGSVESMTYDMAGNLKSIVRPDSTTVTYDYDKLNNLVSKSYSEDDSSVLYLYDTAGNRTSMTDTTGETSYTYDIMGRVTSVTSENGKTVGYAYDDCGRLGAIIYADGRTVSYGYDLNDRLVSVTDGNQVTTYSYDAIGRVVETSRPNGTKTTYTYDVRGNLTELVNADDTGAVISSFAYTYDAQGYITKEIAQDGEGTVTREYTYNLSGELTKFTEKDGLKVASYTYTYDDSGNRIRLEKAGIDQPETITYTYNAANQLVSETSTIDGTTCYTYNKNGSLVTEQTEDKAEITYEYTVEQRLSAVREGGALLMAASYDGDGNRVFQISRKEAEQYVEKSLLSDASDTPTSPDTGIGSSAGTVPEGNESTENPKVADADLTPIPDVAQNDQAQVHTYYERVYADPGESIFWYGFGQGILQFFSGINSSLGAYLSDWFCDLWDFVTGQYELVLHSEATVQESYAGSDVETLRSAGLSEQEIAQITGGTLDESGKVAVKTISTDASGDKQVSGTSPQAAQKSSADETIVIPENPSEGQRVDYELTYYVNNVNAENTQVLMEYGKRDELKNVYTYGNERISVETIADTYNAVNDDFQMDYYLYDGRGSVVNVVSAEAEILTSYTYEPFGNVTSGAPEFDSFYGYNGEETNPVTGLQYLRARYYDTDTGRFNVADTYLGDISQPLTLNRYSYTVNNPVMQIDPSGHWPGWLDKAVNTVKTGVKKAVDWVDDHVVKPVVNTVKSAANWVNDKVVKPVVNTVKSAVNTVKSAASWVNENVVQPVVNKAKNTGEAAKKKTKEVLHNVQQGYEDIKQAAVQTYQETKQYTKQYIEKKTEELKQSVAEFSCGVAENLSNTWENTVNWWNNIEWGRVAQGAMIIAGGAIVITVGAAAIAATGGLALASAGALLAGGTTFTAAHGVVIGTALAGVASVGFGASDIVEGVENIAHGLDGDIRTAAFNPIRDTVFNNRLLTPDMYYATEMLASYGAAIGTEIVNQNRAYYEASCNKGGSDYVQIEGRGTTGRTTPNDLIEDMAMDNTMKNPFDPGEGNSVSKIIDSLNDERWKGWEKWQVVYRTDSGRNVTIHFSYDPINNLFDDFKFK